MATKKRKADGEVAEDKQLTKRAKTETKAAKTETKAAKTETKATKPESKATKKEKKGKGGSRGDRQVPLVPLVPPPLELFARDFGDEIRAFYKAAESDKKLSEYDMKQRIRTAFADCVGAHASDQYDQDAADICEAAGREPYDYDSDDGWPRELKEVTWPKFGPISARKFAVARNKRLMADIVRLKQTRFFISTRKDDRNVGAAPGKGPDEYLGIPGFCDEDRWNFLGSGHKWRHELGQKTKSDLGYQLWLPLDTNEAIAVFEYWLLTRNQSQLDLLESGSPVFDDVMKFINDQAVLYQERKLNAVDQWKNWVRCHSVHSYLSAYRLKTLGGPFELCMNVASTEPNAAKQIVDKWKGDHKIDADGFEDWETCRNNALYCAYMGKFIQDRYARSMLLATGSARLIRSTEHRGSFPDEVLEGVREILQILSDRRPKCLGCPERTRWATKNGDEFAPMCPSCYSGQTHILARHTIPMDALDVTLCALSYQTPTMIEVTSPIMVDCWPMPYTDRDLVARQQPGQEYDQLVVALKEPVGTPSEPR